MDTLESQFSSMLQEQFSARKLGAKLIRSKLRKKGITLTEEQLKEVEAQLETKNLDEFVMNLDDEQVKAAGLNPDVPFSIEIDSSDIERIEEAIGKVIAEAAPAMASEVSDLLLKEWKEQSPSLLLEQRTERERFAKHVHQIWGEAIDLLEILISVTYESGAEFNNHFRTSAAQDDFVFDALIRLHARGCQVGLEILTLLRNGFADGAHARWRTLHELVVTAFFVSKYGKDVAERYLNHAGIETYKAALKHQEHCRALGYEPIPEVEMRNIQSQKDSLVARFGRPYRGDYGWAANVLGKDEPKFTDIEQNVGLEHLRPFYKMANNNVHAGSKGTLFRLGLAPSQNDLLLAGPSQFGLSEPAQNTAVSINQLTTNLLATRPNVDALAFTRATRRLVRIIFDKFAEIASKPES